RAFVGVAGVQGELELTAETTIIIVSSDAGDTKYDHHSDGKGNAYGSKDTPYGTVVFPTDKAAMILKELPAIVSAFDKARSANEALQKQIQQQTDATSKVDKAGTMADIQKDINENVTDNANVKASFVQIEKQIFRIIQDRYGDLVDAKEKAMVAIDHALATK